jgi:protein-disulfide isomerase
MKNRSFLLFPLGILISMFLVWAYLRTIAKITKSNQIETSLKTLPNVTILGIDSVVKSEVFPQREDFAHATIVFYFDPDCEHCQSEAKALKKQAAAFADVHLLWLSVAPLAKLKAFEREYELEKTFGASLKIAQITNEVADKTFGFRVVPTILIYDSHQKLTKKYVGETKIESLQKYIAQPYR